MIKIRNGTPSHNRPSLCVSCRQAVITKGHSERDLLITCGSHDRQIYFHVTECSGYQDKTEPTKFDFEKLAWHINVDQKRGKIGFESPDDRNKAGTLHDYDY